MIERITLSLFAVIIAAFAFAHVKRERIKAEAFADAAHVEAVR